MIQVPLRSDRVPDSLWISAVFASVPWAPGRLSYPPGPISGFVGFVAVFMSLAVMVTGPSRKQVLVRKALLGRVLAGF